MSSKPKIYFALLHKEPGSAFGLSFPDLPGCHSAADDEADIISAAQDALSLYLSDSPTRSASTLEQMLAAPAVRAELAAGAALIAVPSRSPMSARSVAASALSQTMSSRVTSKAVADKAAKLLKDPKANKAIKSAAASALTQAADKKPAAKKNEMTAAFDLRRKPRRP